MSKYQNEDGVFIYTQRPKLEMPQTEIDALIADYGQTNVENAYIFLDARTDAMGILYFLRPTPARVRAVLKAAFD